MTDAIRPRINWLEYDARTRLEAAAAGKVSTPRASTPQTEQARAKAKADHEARGSTGAVSKGGAPPSRDARTRDVLAMSPEQAEATLIQLKTLKKLGGIEHMGIDAVNGDLRTASLDVYMSWLAERALSVTNSPTADSGMVMSAIIDIKV